MSGTSPSLSSSGSALYRGDPSQIQEHQRRGRDKAKSGAERTPRGANRNTLNALAHHLWSPSQNMSIILLAFSSDCFLFADSFRSALIVIALFQVAANRQGTPCLWGRKSRLFRLRPEPGNPELRRPKQYDTLDRNRSNRTRSLTEVHAVPIIL